MSKYKTQLINGHFVISAHEVWIPGVYDTAETAISVADTFSDEEIEELFGPIYTVGGENRPVTMEDYERIKDEPREVEAPLETD